MTESTVLLKSSRIRKHVTIPESEHRRLQMLRAATGRSATDIVSSLINDAYNKYRSVHDGSKEKR